MKEQIEYLRQRKYRPIASTFHYYWRDPCPIMGSGLLDYYRRRYQVYDTFKAVYGRVLISLERDVKPYVIGRPKVYDRGSTFVGTVWVTNDFTEPIEGTQVSWRITRTDVGGVLAGNDLTWTLSADGAEVVDEIVVGDPVNGNPGRPPYRDAGLRARRRGALHEPHRHRRSLDLGRLCGTDGSERRISRCRSSDWEPRAGAPTGSSATSIERGANDRSSCLGRRRHPLRHRRDVRRRPVRRDAREALGSRRDEAVIATKVFFGTKPTTGVGLSGGHLLAPCEDSLRRLGPTGSTCCRCTAGTASRRSTRRSRRSTSSSRAARSSQWGLELVGLAPDEGPRDRGAQASPLRSQQIYYSLQARRPSTSWSPLARPGRRHPRLEPARRSAAHGEVATRCSSPARYETNAGMARPADLRRGSALADDRRPRRHRLRAEVGVPRIALTYLLHKPGVTSLVIGARTEEQLLENLPAAELALDDDELRSARRGERSAAALPVLVAGEVRRASRRGRPRGAWPISGGRGTRRPAPAAAGVRRDPRRAGAVAGRPGAGTSRGRPAR